MIEENGQLIFHDWEEHKLREVGSFEITSYDLEGGHIVITKVKVLDKDGKYLKFAKLDQVLSRYPVVFKSKSV